MTKTKWKEFFKSIWIPLLIFLILEVIAYFIGYSIKWQATCEICPPAPKYCPPCPSGNYGIKYLIAGIIPSLIISIIAYFIYKKIKREK